MTPKEKAEDLIRDYVGFYLEYKVAKECAINTAEEVINLSFNINCDAAEKCVNPVIDFWNEVLNELKKL